MAEVYGCSGGALLGASASPDDLLGPERFGEATNWALVYQCLLLHATEGAEEAGW